MFNKLIGGVVVVVQSLTGYLPGVARSTFGQQVIGQFVSCAVQENVLGGPTLLCSWCFVSGFLCALFLVILCYGGFACASSSLLPGRR